MTKFPMEDPVGCLVFGGRTDVGDGLRPPRNFSRLVWRIAFELRGGA
jgi:hypothetical protein